MPLLAGREFTEADDLAAPCVAIVNEAFARAFGLGNDAVGKRIAIGADAARVRAMVLGQVARMAVVGGAVGLGAALVVGRAARAILFGLEGHDPLAVIAAMVTLGVIALGAGYLPARRAAAVEPVSALRE